PNRIAGVSSHVVCTELREAAAQTDAVLRDPRDYSAPSRKAVGQSHELTECFELKLLEQCLVECGNGFGDAVVVNQQAYVDLVRALADHFDVDVSISQRGENAGAQAALGLHVLADDADNRLVADHAYAPVTFEGPHRLV